MESNGYRWHRLARMKWYGLTPEDQTRVERFLDALSQVPVSQWPEGTVRPLPADHALSLIHIDHSLRAIAETADDHLGEVLDIVRQETLDAFARDLAKARS